ncbi:hypothetical protein JCM8097_005325 [Rhodosporidiobolus ruineniae]
MISATGSNTRATSQPLLLNSTAAPLPPPPSSVRSDAVPLPHELHLLIVEHGAEYTYVAYSQRQAFLRACCLVSRRWRFFAQPLLKQVAHVGTVYGPDGYVPEGVSGRIDYGVRPAHVHAGLGKTLRVLVLSQVGPQISGEILPRCSALEHLGLSDLWRVELDGVDFPHLRSLTMTNVRTVSPPAHLPQLVELSLSGVHLHLPTLSRFLRQSVLPSLRALALLPGGLRVNPAAPAPELSKAVSPEMLNQLDTLSLDSDDFLSPSTTPDLLFVLYARDLADDHEDHSTALLNQARYVRLGCSPSRCKDVSQTPAELLARWTEHLRTNRNRTLKRIYLPTAFRPSPSKDAELNGRVGALLALCLDLEIDLRFADADEGPGASQVSKGFWEFARWKKREKDQARVAAGEAR